MQQHRLFPWTLAAIALGTLGFGQTRSPAPDASVVEERSRPEGKILLPGELARSAPPSANRFVGEAAGQPIVFDDAVPWPRVPGSEAGAARDATRAESSTSPLYLGFAAGNHHPAAEERLDPLLLVAAQRALARGASHTYAFVLFDKRMTPERVSTLEALGLRVLGFHPGYCLKVAVPLGALELVSRLDFVRWIGVAQPGQKMQPQLARLAAQSAPEEWLDVYVDVFESDLNAASISGIVGRQSRAERGVVSEVEGTEATSARVTQSRGPQELALAELGVQILSYEDGIRAFRARVQPGLLPRLVAQDFVQFVELDAPRALAHDESTPMLGNDIVRWWYPGNTSGVINVGQVDSGVDAGHAALGIWAWGWDFTGAGNAFTDGCEHGTHVMGTVLGNGAGSYTNSLSGVAPGLARNGDPSLAFVARIFDDNCSGNAVPLSTVFSVFRNDLVLPGGTARRPVAINNSWGSAGSYWLGTEAEARTVDAEVFDHDQLYVFAAGNEGSAAGTCRLQACAKNALTVGAIVDFEDPASGIPGSLASFSSRGPCGDGRWKPNVVAPGSLIRSVDANSGSLYSDMSGTSMAAPHVTGIAAQISDAVSWLRYQPAAVASVLMSSAETKSEVGLLQPTDWHLRTYGAGKVQECKAVLGSSDYYWNTWAFQTTWPNYYPIDFNVPAGTKQITIAMNYYEPAASAGANVALVNNWDLWIDDPINGIDPGANTGDYFAQQSSLDNCEIRTLYNPTAGTWRLKAYPQSVVPFSTVKMGVTVTFELNSSTCSPVLTVQTPSQFVQPGQITWVNANLSNYAGLASSAFFDSTSSGNALSNVTGGLFDGSTASYIGNPTGGRDVVVGDIPPFFGRGIDWFTSWATEGVKPFRVDAWIDNYVGVVPNQTVYVTVDGTPPSPITGLYSFNHTPNQWSTVPQLYFAWNVPTDNLSGVQGYAIALSVNTPIDPGFAVNIANVSTAAVTATSSSQPYYFSMRAVDNANNWQASYVSDGPYYIDDIAPQGPFGVQSSSHGSTPSCDATIELTWSAALDYESFIAGYRVVADTSPSTEPSGSLTDPWWATSSTVSAPDGFGVYCHVRAMDYAGNWGPTQHAGPFHVFSTGIVAAYCVPKVNSLGCSPVFSSSGIPSASAASGFTLNCSNVRNQKPGLVIYSITGSAQAPFQGGFLCVAPPIRRTSGFNSGGTAPGSNDCTGVYSIDFNAFARGSLGGTPAPELSVAGTQVFAQFWGRDPGFAPPSNSALSSALQFVMCN